MKVSKKANLRKRYNQVPHLTQDTVWESDKTQENISLKRAKRLALFQQVAVMILIHNFNDSQNKHHIGMVSKKMTEGRIENTYNYFCWNRPLTKS